MKTTHVLTAALALSACACLASTQPAAERTGSFRLVGAYADPTEVGIDSGWGGLLQLAGTFDEGEVALEVGRFQFDQTEEMAIYGYDVTLDGSLRVAPLVVTARWAAKLDSRGSVRLLIGPTFGWSYTRVSGHVTGDLVGGGTASRWVMTYGGDVGLVWRASERVELALGYKYLVLGSADWNVEGYEVEVGDYAANLFYAGLGWRF